jgi:hypothetical protein
MADVKPLEAILVLYHEDTQVAESIAFQSGLQKLSKAIGRDVSWEAYATPQLMVEGLSARLKAADGLEKRVVLVAPQTCEGENCVAQIYDNAHLAGVAGTHFILIADLTNDSAVRSIYETSNATDNKPGQLPKIMNVANYEGVGQALIDAKIFPKTEKPGSRIPLPTKTSASGTTPPPPPKRVPATKAPASDPAPVGKKSRVGTYVGLGLGAAALLFTGIVVGYRSCALSALEEKASDDSAQVLGKYEHLNDRMRSALESKYHLNPNTFDDKIDKEALDTHAKLLDQYVGIFGADMSGKISDALLGMGVDELNAKKKALEDYISVYGAPSNPEVATRLLARSGGELAERAEEGRQLLASWNAAHPAQPPVVCPAPDVNQQDVQDVQAQLDALRLQYEGSLLTCSQGTLCDLLPPSTPDASQPVAPVATAPVVAEVVAPQPPAPVAPSAPSTPSHPADSGAGGYHGATPYHPSVIGVHNPHFIPASQRNKLPGSSGHGYRH